ncbi:hypothetical protein [Labilithrix luteola]|uniref:hypothetical protein n=1 Tax=Labilithrix luteola TaxID=1391654 RepID=UPI0014767363|nr:hypothetical protein [Labilithrix luteola]
MKEPSGPPTLADLALLLERGPSLLAVTRSAAMRPAIVRCCAARVVGEAVEFSVPLPEGRLAIENLDATGVVSLTAARPTTYQTIQAKGTNARRVVWPEQSDVAVAHRGRFRAETTMLGIEGPPNGFWSMTDVVVFSFVVHELFDQTPGFRSGLLALR